MITAYPEAYGTLLDEIRNDLIVGQVRIGPTVMNENRMTTLYTMEDTSVKMVYSGREVKAKIPRLNGVIYTMFESFHDPTYRLTIFEHYGIVIPFFNSVFVNWYRPPTLTSPKIDYIGYHSDDIQSLRDETIYIITICEDTGKRIFRFRKKGTTSGYEWQQELSSGSLLIMNKGCQDVYKHSVINNKTSLNKTPITGGRISLTFRSLRIN